MQVGPSTYSDQFHLNDVTRLQEVRFLMKDGTIHRQDGKPLIA